MTVGELHERETEEARMLDLEGGPHREPSAIGLEQMDEARTALAAAAAFPCVLG